MAALPCTKPPAAIIDLDLQLLADKIVADYKATRKAFASLVNRPLLEVEGDAKAVGRRRAEIGVELHGSSLAHVPEKWEPVFRIEHAQTQRI